MQLLQRVALGSFSGAIATMFMQLLLEASPKIIPGGKAPIRKDPGVFMVELTLPPGSPDALQKAAAKSLHFAYGTSAGATYAALRPRGGHPLVDGAILGAAVWAAGYLGWLPALDLMPPVTRQRPRQVAVPFVQHLLFGIAVAALYTGVIRTASRRTPPDRRG